MSTETYEMAVARQIERLSKGKRPGYNPATHPLHCSTEETLLWSLPISAKPFKPKSEIISTFTIFEEEVLVELWVPRQFKGLYIEREIVPIAVGQQFHTLIERVFCLPRDAYRELELAAASSLFIWQDTSELRVRTELPDSKLGSVITRPAFYNDGRKPREFLSDHLRPLVFFMIPPNTQGLELD